MYVVLQDIDIGSYSVCKRDVHRYVCILCFRILVLGHTQCVRLMSTDFYIYILFQDTVIGSYSVCKRCFHRYCVYCVSGYLYLVILSV